MQKIGRQRRSESTWREILERQSQSGLSVRAFCEREGIKAVSLYVWRSRLRQGPQEQSAPVLRKIASRGNRDE
jgi:transposase-like protein